MLNATEAKTLIEKAGGKAEFAKLLGIDGDEWWSQRVHNWTVRGMPAAVVLEHYDTIQQLRAQSVRRRKQAS